MIFESYKFEECPKKLQVIKKRGRFVQKPTLPNKCYERKLPISSAKFKDLSDLCNNGIIPEKFHTTYVHCMLCVCLNMYLGSKK